MGSPSEGMDTLDGADSRPWSMKIACKEPCSSRIVVVLFDAVYIE